MPVYRYLIYIICTLILSFSGYCQNRKIDSLITLVNNSKSDTIRLWNKNLIAEEYFNFNPDTAIKIWNDLRSELNLKLKKANVNEKVSLKRTLAEVINSIGAYYYVTGNSDKALEEWNNSISIRRELKDEYGIALSYVNIGFFYYNKRDLYSAVDYWQKCLAIADRINNSVLQSSSLNCLAGLYFDIKDVDKALETYSKLLEIKYKTNDLFQLESIHLNVASIYEDTKNYKEAWYHVKKSLFYSEKFNSLETMAGALKLQGSLYLRQHNLDSALYLCKKSYEICTKNNFLQLKTTVCSNLSEILLAKKDYKNAILYGEEAYDLAQKSESPFSKIEACLQLSFVYEKINKPDMALKFLRKYYIERESMEKKNKDTELLKKQLTFDHERDKITLQKEQEKKDVIAKEEKQKQKIILIAVTLVLILITGLLFFIYRSYNLKKKANAELEEKNMQILEQKALVEEHQKEILDSIHYAKRIQQSLMPTEKYLERKIRKQ